MPRLQVHEPSSGSGSGLDANKPAATAVTAGYLYYASDTVRLYRSDGTAWTQIGGLAGVELGRAEITSNVALTTPTSLTDVTGLTRALTVGTRPVELKWTGYFIQTTATATITLAIVEGATIIASKAATLAAGAYFFPGIEVVKAPSAGAHTYKCQGTATAGNLTIAALATAPSQLVITEK